MAIQQKIKREIKFDFDDMLIEPEVTTDILSRYKNINPYINDNKLPLFTAPMDTVVDLMNDFYFSSNHINVVYPRTITHDMIFKEYPHTVMNNFISFGINDILEYLDSDKKLNLNVRKVLIDVANGHAMNVINIINKIKKQYPNIILMVGNIANPETYKWYAKNTKVDYIRLGIGGGNGCLTSQNLGVGYPMASLIHETKKIKNDLIFQGCENLPKIVADGGMKDYADIVKALGLGADYVMLGSLFNKALESCAVNYLYGKIKVNKKIAKILFKWGFPIKKYFRGMSTKAAQKAMGRKDHELKTSEGVIRFRNVEYTLDSWVENFEHYLRSAMSYTNKKNLDEFIGNINFNLITENAFNRFNK